MTHYPNELNKYFVKLNNHFRFFSANTAYIRVGIGDVPNSYRVEDPDFDNLDGHKKIVFDIISPSEPAIAIEPAMKLLIKAIKKYLRENLKNGRNSVLFWRVIPEITEWKDFETNQTHYRGYTRLAIYNG